MMVRYKCRNRPGDIHCDLFVFVGMDRNNLASAGTLCMRLPEWEAFKHMMLDGRYCAEFGTEFDGFEFISLFSSLECMAVGLPEAEANAMRPLMPFGHITKILRP